MYVSYIAFFFNYAPLARTPARVCVYLYIYIYMRAWHSATTQPHSTFQVNIFFPSSMKTPGFEEEERTKPTECKQIEGTASLFSSADSAAHLLDGLRKVDTWCVLAYACLRVCGVFVCACGSVRVFVFACACVCVSACACCVMSLCVHACARVCVFVCMCTYT